MRKIKNENERSITSDAYEGETRENDESMATLEADDKEESTNISRNENYKDAEGSLTVSVSSSSIDDSDNMLVASSIYQGHELSATKREITSETTKKLAREDRMSLFEFKGYNVQAASFRTYGDMEENEREEAHNVYTFQSRMKEEDLLNIVFYPPRSLDLTGHIAESDFMNKAMSGVFRRTKDQLNGGNITTTERERECKEAVEVLTEFYHQLIQYPSLGRIKEPELLQSKMIAGVLYNIDFRSGKIQCIENCENNKEDSDDVNSSQIGENGDVCVHCGSVLIYTPMNISDMRFLLSKEKEEKFRQEGVGSYLSQYKSYVQSGLDTAKLQAISRSLKLKNFTQGVIPATVILQSESEKGGKKDRLHLETYLLKKDDEKLTAFTSIEVLVSKEDGGKEEDQENVILNKLREVIKNEESVKELSEWFLTRRLETEEITDVITLETVLETDESESEGDSSYLETESKLIENNESEETGGEE